MSSILDGFALQSKTWSTCHGFDGDSPSDWNTRGYHVCGHCGKKYGEHHGPFSKCHTESDIRAAVAELLETHKDEVFELKMALQFALARAESGSGEATTCEQAASVAVPEGWPTDEMVVRGAEELHDSLRTAGVRFDFDRDLNGTEIQQKIAENVFNTMLSASPQPATGAQP